MEETQQPRHDLRSSLSGQSFQRAGIPLLISAFLFVLYFLPYLSSTSLGIDSHFSIEYPGNTYNWLDIGRQGAVLINKLFLRSQFSMFYVEAAACVLCLLALVLFAFLFDRLAAVPSWKSGLFFLFFMVHPIWTEQFYFVIQVFPIAFGIAVLPIALYFAYSKKPLLWCAAAACMVLIFSIYQTFVILYVAGCILCFLLWYIQSVRSDTPPAVADLLRLGIRQVLLFVGAYCINSVVTSAFFSSSDYLTGQVKWGEEPFSACIQNIVTHMVQVATGAGVFFTPGFPLSVLALFAAAVLFFLRHRSAKGKWLVTLALLFLQVTPFLLTIYGGTIPAVRSQFVLPFVTGCNFLLSLTLVELPGIRSWRTTALTAGPLLFMVLILAWQYYPASLLQYSTALVQQNDLQLAYDIEEKLLETTSGCTKPIAFIGQAAQVENGSFVVGDIAQSSLFSYGSWGNPPYVELTVRAVSYMKALGFSLRSANEDQISAARTVAQRMPSFPAEGSIQETDSFIVVKLGADDSFASKQMAPEVTLVQEDPQLVFEDTLRGCVNSCALEDGIFTVSAWILEPYHDSNYVIPQVHLWDQENQILYTLNSGTLSTSELNALYQENTDYSHSGVMGKAAVDQLPETLEECRILLSLTEADGIQFFDSNVSVGDLMAN